MENQILIYKEDEINVDAIKLYLEENEIKVSICLMPGTVFDLTGGVDIANMELYVEKKDKEKAISLIKEKLKNDKTVFEEEQRKGI